MDPVGIRPSENLGNGIVDLGSILDQETLRLDDAVSMNPAQELSKATQVEVVVRLSRSGSPMAQPGDWEWRSATVDLPGLEGPLKLEALLRPPEPAGTSG